MAAFIPFSIEPSENGFTVRNHEERVQLYEFETTPEKPELCAIFKLTRDLQRHVGSGAKTQVAIITDTELGSLDAFNAGTLPIYNEHFLPDGFTLMYASSDTGWEVANRFIRLCDKAAEQTIQERRSGDLPLQSFTPMEGVPNVNLRVGRRNAKLTIHHPNLTEMQPQPGQPITLWGRRKKD